LATLGALVCEPLKGFRLSSIDQLGGLVILGDDYCPNNTFLLYFEINIEWCQRLYLITFAISATLQTIIKSLESHT